MQSIQPVDGENVNEIGWYVQIFSYKEPYFSTTDPTQCLSFFHRVYNRGQWITLLFRNNKWILFESLCFEKAFIFNKGVSRFVHMQKPCCFCKKNHFTTLIFWSMEFTYISADVSLVGSSIPTDSSAQSMAAAPWDFHCNCSFRWRKTFEVLGTRKTYSRHLILSLGQQEKEAWMKDIKSTRSWG